MTVKGFELQSSRVIEKRSNNTDIAHFLSGCNRLLNFTKSNEVDTPKCTHHCCDVVCLSSESPALSFVHFVSRRSLPGW